MVTFELDLPSSGKKILAPSLPLFHDRVVDQTNYLTYSLVEISYSIVENSLSLLSTSRKKLTSSLHLLGQVPAPHRT